MCRLTVILIHRNNCAERSEVLILISRKNLEPEVELEPKVEQGGGRKRGDRRKKKTEGRTTEKSANTTYGQETFRQPEFHLKEVGFT